MGGEAGRGRGKGGEGEGWGRWEDRGGPHFPAPSVVTAKEQS